MTSRDHKIDHYPYLRRRGGSFEVRLQVPKRLRPIVGQSELKKSLGGDPASAKRNYHSTVGGFKDQIKAAQAKLGSSSAFLSLPKRQPRREEIDDACYSYFKHMVANLPGKVILPRGASPSKSGQQPDHRTRVEGVEQMLGHLLETQELDGWSTMSLEADELSKQHGWHFDTTSPDYQYLCRTILRGRIEAFRTQLRLMRDGYSTPAQSADPMFGPKPPSLSKRPATLGQLMIKFKGARSLNWSASTTKNYIIIFRVIEEICGQDVALTDIDHEFCISVRNRLLEVPANYQKHPATRGRSLSEAIQIAADNGLPTISPATVNSHLNKLGAIIRYARDQGWMVGNPMAGIDVSDPVDADEKRDPFSIEQLNAIFACSPWKEGAALAIERPSRFWAPLVALYSGARLSEICGQKVEEMIVEGGVRALHLRHRPDDRTIKNGKSRKVPIHQQLVQLGFWDFVEAAQASGRDMLFGDVTRDRYGKWGDGTSKWFSRLVRKLDLKGANLAFHSFRHNFEDALKEIDLHDTPIGNTLTGRWSAGVSKNYGKAYSLTKLGEAIQRVSYPGLKLDHLIAAGAQRA